MRLLLALSVAALLGGCVVHAHSGPPPHRTVIVEEEYRPAPTGNVVVVERVHVHDDFCGHYWYNGAWYLHTGHRHGPGCGHVFHDGHWVMAGEVVVRQGHVHDAHCGHYFYSGTWYYMHNHHHGPGCGHNWNGRVWVSVRL
jgi:hypothetical protein